MHLILMKHFIKWPLLKCTGSSFYNFPKSPTRHYKNKSDDINLNIIFITEDTTDLTYIESLIISFFNTIKIDIDL